MRALFSQSPIVLQSAQLGPALIGGGILVLLGVYVGALSKSGETVQVRVGNQDGDTLALEPTESSD